MSVTANLGGVVEYAARLDPSLDEAKVTVAMIRLDAIWGQFFQAAQQRIVRLLVDKVIVSMNDIEVRFRPNGIEALALELRPERSGIPWGGRGKTNSSGTNLDSRKAGPAAKS